jgi:hypothetical protein
MLQLICAFWERERDYTIHKSQQKKHTRKEVFVYVHEPGRQRGGYTSRGWPMSVTLSTHELFKLTKSLDYHGNLFVCDLTRHLSSISLPLCASQCMPASAAASARKQCGAWHWQEARFSRFVHTLQETRFVALSTVTYVVQKRKKNGKELSS